MSKLPKTARIYIGTIIFLGIMFLLIVLKEATLNIYVLKGIVYFTALAVITESLKVSLPRGGYISVTFAVTYTTVLLFGAAAAALVEIAASVFNKFFSKDKSPWYKLIFNCSQLIICVCIAQLIYQNTGGTIGVVNPSNFVPLVVSGIGYFFVNTVAVSVILAILQNVSPWDMWVINAKWTLPNLFALTLLSILMSGIYNYAGYWGISLFFVPLLLARFIFKSYMEVRQNYMDTLAALVSALDAKDKYTKGHSERVAEYASLIATAMKLPEDQVEKIQHMALLHDVGKIGIADDILCKRDKLTAEEFEIIKGHSELGAKIIEAMEDLAVSKEYILYHHEQYAGGGYPHGLSGEDIPLGARIISVADAFDAMTSDRAYRPRKSFHEAFAILEEMSGQQFDPEVVKAFLCVMDEKRKIQVPTNCDSVLPHLSNGN